MTNPAWEKKSTDPPIYQGPSQAEQEAISAFDPDTKSKILTILEALEFTEILIFNYDGLDRVVAPFVVGVSSLGNPLLRAFQIEGESYSGKHGGWRVFQIVKIINLEIHHDFFDPLDFKFNEFYPWVYGVIKML